MLCAEYQCKAFKSEEKINQKALKKVAKTRTEVRTIWTEVKICPSKSRKVSKIENQDKQ